MCQEGFVWFARFSFEFQIQLEIATKLYAGYSNLQHPPTRLATMELSLFLYTYIKLICHNQHMFATCSVQCCLLRFIDISPQSAFFAVVGIFFFPRVAPPRPRGRLIINQLSVSNAHLGLSSPKKTYFIFLLILCSHPDCPRRASLLPCAFWHSLMLRVSSALIVVVVVFFFVCV